MVHVSSQPLQLLDVNCTVLDSLVLEFLQKEQLVEVAGPTDDESLLIGKLAAFAAYQQLHEGNVCNAMAIVQQYCPEVLQDQRLAFKLKRQQFIELLRQGDAAGDAAALACARDELAPLALDAYPEAYLDFKRALLMLVQSQQGQQQQQQQQQQHEDWSLQARHQLAEVLHHTMLQQIGWRSPQLSQLLVYLLHLYSLYTRDSHGSSRAGGSSQAQTQLVQAAGAELVAGLLLEGRDEAPLPPDIAGRITVERDVMALMAAVSIPRQAAVDALKAAGGDAAAALAAQLMRFRLSKQQVDALVWDYAAARGLVEPDDGLTPAAATDGPAAATDGPAAAPADMDVDCAAPTAAAAAAAGGTPCASSSKSAGKRSKGSVAGDTAAGGEAARSTTAATATPAAADTAAGAAAGASSPFTAAGGLMLAPAGACGPDQAGMLRSESQSPPYKVPRWRCRQTPSRFFGQVPAAAAAAAGNASGAAQQQQQGMGMGDVSELRQMVVESPGGAAGVEQAGRDCEIGAGSRPGKKQTQAQQQQQQQSKQQLANGEGGSSSSLAQQLVQQVRHEQQARRWQQLQQQLKSQAAASGTLAKQQQVQQALLQLQGLVKQGSFQEVEQLVEDLQPGLLQEYHMVKFDLKRCQFMQLAQANQLPAALQLARSQLTPLADQHPELLPSLKASMAMLLPGPFGGSSSSSSASSDWGSSLLTQLLPLLQAKLGLEPPKLVKLLRVLLTGHKLWFKVQRCQDSFAPALGLDKLLAVEAAPGSVAGAAAGAAGGVATPGAAQQQRQGAGEAGDAAAGGAVSGGAAAGAAGAGGAPAAAAGVWPGGLEFVDDAVMEMDEGDDDLEFDEAAVLQVMEVLELPRATALELLAEQGGDAQAVIMQAFGA